MSSHCEDCGTRTYGGICSNCQEELYILQNQAEFVHPETSLQFYEKAKEQSKKQPTIKKHWG